MNPKITIIDYGIGNVLSIKSKIESLNYECNLSSDINEIYQSNKLILPGVGNIEECMSRLNSMNISKFLIENIKTKKFDLLGICVGFQMLFEESEEGNTRCLKLVKGKLKKFSNDNPKKKIPNVGWGEVIPDNKNIRILKGINENSFYFTHSYYLDKKYFIKDYSDTNIGFTKYFTDNIVSVIERENIFGVQFHPEKSNQDGLSLLKNFITL